MVGIMRRGSRERARREAKRKWDLGIRSLPYGTVVHVGGIPIKLLETVVAETAPGNWALVADTRSDDDKNRKPPSDLWLIVVCAVAFLCLWSGFWLLIWQGR